MVTMPPAVQSKVHCRGQAVRRILRLRQPWLLFYTASNRAVLKGNFLDFIVCAVLVDAAPGTRLTQFESRSVSQILVTGMDDRQKLRLQLCVAVILLKGLDEKDALHLVYYHR